MSPEEYIGQYPGHIWRLAFNHAKNAQRELEAADFYGAAVLRLLKTKTYRPTLGCKPQTYYTTVSNCAMLDLRRRVNKGGRGDIITCGWGQIGEDLAPLDLVDMSYRATIGRVKARSEIPVFWERLTKRERRVLYLRFWRGFTNNEVAEELGVHKSTALQLYQRALKKAKGCLNQNRTVNLSA